MLTLVDGDVITYRCAAATDRTSYNVHGEVFRYKADATEYCDANGLPYGEIVPFKITEPISHTYHSMDMMLEKILEETGATGSELYLTGDDNYRHKIAYTLPYKGNRDRDKAPCNLSEARSYLVDNYGAIVVNGAEADDLLGVRQTECLKSMSDSCIATSDKDLLQVPGWHYNILTGKMSLIDEHAARYAFWKQVLTGDRSDNITGVAGIGPKTADRILKELFTEEDFYATSLAAYQRTYGTSGKDRLVETAQLVWVQRERGVLWEPPN